MAIVNVAGLDYHMNDALKAKWDKIKDGKLKKIDNDRVYVVDGRERTGKSTFAMQQACYIDPTLVNDLSRICFTADEFLEAVRKTDSTLEITKCIIFDEAFRGLASRGAMTKTNKKIIQALMEVGQKNLVIWIILPSFFMLDLYPAMIRSNALFHLTIDKRSTKRVFYVYPHNKKGLLYQIGVRKGWNYNIRTKAKGYFYSKFPKLLKEATGNDFYDKYLKKKKNSLTEEQEITKTYGMVDEKTTDVDKIVNKWHGEGLSTRKIVKRLKEELDISRSQGMIVQILKKLRAKDDFAIKKAIFMREREENAIIE